MNSNSDAVRERLEQRRNHLAARRSAVLRDLRHVTTPLSHDFADQALERNNDDALAAIEKAAAEEIVAIEEALDWLAQGKYGTCKVCGRDISPARLAAVPHTVHCASC